MSSIYMGHVLQMMFQISIDQILTGLATFGKLLNLALCPTLKISLDEFCLRFLKALT